MRFPLILLQIVHFKGMSFSNVFFQVVTFFSGFLFDEKEIVTIGILFHLLIEAFGWYSVKFSQLGVNKGFYDSPIRCTFKSIPLQQAGSSF
jgi:hypothetical protein